MGITFAAFRIFLCFMSLTAAAPAVDWVVQVVDTAGRPIPGVRVRGSGTKVGSPATVLTDAQGEWRVSIPAIGGSSCIAFSDFTVTSVTKPGYTFDKTVFGLPCTGMAGEARMTVVGTGTPLPSWTAVSAASYQRGVVAPEMIVSVFGNGLVGGTEAAASLPLPTALQGRSVKFVMPEGFEFLCPLLFVSPTQINFVVPFHPILPTEGERLALIVLNDGTRDLREDFVSHRALSPARFSVDFSGRGLAAALVFRVRADGSGVYEPVSRFDAATNANVAVPIEFTPDTQRLVLVLFGTGFRKATKRSDVQVAIAGRTLPVEFSGPQPEWPGLDQINVELPPGLAGSGDSDVLATVNGLASNPVHIVLR